MLSVCYLHDDSDDADYDDEENDDHNDDGGLPCPTTVKSNHGVHTVQQ